MVLARTAEEAKLVASRVPASAARFLREWSTFGTESLVVTTAGFQPNPSYRLRFSSVSVLRAGKQIVAFGRIEQRGDAPAELSVPWMVIAVAAPSVLLGKKCLISYEGVTGIETNCR